MTRTCIIWFAAFMGGALSISAASGADEASSVQVESAPIRQQEIRETVTAYGTMTASEEAMADISFPQSGQITGLQVRVGQKFRSGTPW